MACRPGDREAFNLHELRIPAVIFKDERGEEALIGRGRSAVRLSIYSGTLLKGAVRLIYKMEGRQRLARRLLALRQWEALIRSGCIPRPLAARPANADRSMALIHTLNALAVHSRTRDIAIELFGEQRVARDWAHESDYLRMTTRRLIARARGLAAGGYLKLLAGS